MLVLSRKKNEQIRIGDDVVITVVDVGGNTVRVGIEAPRQIQVLRGELIGNPDAERVPAERTPFVTTR